ncbi:hypothetical protein DF19_28150 [Streptomyces olindensis]|nr:hypothetical protein DF19_28150 [Streptomyces olindensis]
MILESLHQGYQFLLPVAQQGIDCLTRNLCRQKIARLGVSCILDQEFLDEFPCSYDCLVCLPKLAVEECGGVLECFCSFGDNAMAASDELQADLVGEPKSLLYALQRIEDLLTGGRCVLVKAEQDVCIKHDRPMHEEIRSIRAVFGWISLQPVPVLPDQGQIALRALHCSTPSGNTSDCTSL